MMKSLYLITFLTLAFSSSMFTQSVIVPPNLNGTLQFPFTYLDDFISADTTTTGARRNDTYLLETGALYFFTTLNTWTFDVSIKATGDLSKGRPVVARANKTGGTALPGLYRGFGSFTWDGVYLIMGEEGATAAMYESTPFWAEGDNNRYIFNNCIIEKSRQGTIRIEGENTKTFITNCWLRNFGDYERFQGNGRLVDIRDNFADTVVIKNNVVHNILDRLFIGFRARGCDYFDFSQNTVFNHVGRHGLIQLRNAKKSIIKDNLFMNPSIIGTAPFLANEQIKHRDVTNYLFSIDTIVAGASLDMSHNNIFWTQDVLDHYASSTKVTKPEILSPEIVSMLSAPEKAFFTEVLELNNVPGRAQVIKYAREAVLYPDSVGITKMMVEDISFAGSPFDKGYLFDWNKFDPCYSNSAISATAASDGGAVGSRFLCNYPTDTKDLVFNPMLNFYAAPNPAKGFTNFKFDLSAAGQVTINVYDYQGRLVTNVINQKLEEGSHAISWNMSGTPNGLYFVNIQTEVGKMITKVLVQN